MPVAQRSPTDDELRPDVAPDLRRDSESVLQVSRVAAELFWRDGVVATRGEDIAAVAGISVRTLWRYFRSKEACIEPILTSLARPLVDLVAAWPLDRTLEEHLAGRPSSGRVTYTDDQERGMRMVVLGHSEPALRVSWLMICDHFERSMIPVFARRLQLPDDHVDVARITAAVVGANRAFNDSLASEYARTGIPPHARTVAETLRLCITEPSGNRLGPAVTPPAPATKDAR
ncbi:MULTISPECIES: TetR/AcrR family transcriptional regulator [unclassified Microbacterium]|uniref:TetR/AcrR family transcriptional regulator n=1 Tax=unclassified Microbacterium TaxID=2609290 RepID=UPI0034404BCB